jgi:hypothetical protein
VNDDVKTAAQAMSDCVNRAGRSEADALAFEMARDHRTLVQLKASVFIKFFRLLAEDHKMGFFDARNEAACERAAIMCKALDDAGFDFDALPFI